MDWFPLLRRSALAGDTANAFPVESERRVTHVRLNIYPDGGVARLRVHGEVVPDPRLLGHGLPVDLAALENGGLVIDCSNMFYGSPNNLLLPGLARTMGEGWETARRRDDGNDWVLVRLGLPGAVRLVELDTSHFKGNAPGEAMLTGIDASVSELDDRSAWFGVLRRTRLQPDTPAPVPGAAARWAGPPTYGWTCSPTAAWPACACTASPPDPLGPVTLRGRARGPWVGLRPFALLRSTQHLRYRAPSRPMDGRDLAALSRRSSGSCVEGSRAKRSRVIARQPARIECATVTVSVRRPGAIKGC